MIGHFFNLNTLKIFLHSLLSSTASDEKVVVQGIPLLPIFKKALFPLLLFTICSFSLVFNSSLLCLFILFDFHDSYCISQFLCYQTQVHVLTTSVQFSSVQSLSHVRLFSTPWIAACQASLSITNTQSSLRLTSIESVMPSSHLILCPPLLLLTPIPPSIRVFSNESTLHMRWPKY